MMLREQNELLSFKDTPYCFSSRIFSMQEDFEVNDIPDFDCGNYP